MGVGTGAVDAHSLQALGARLSNTSRLYNISTSMNSTRRVESVKRSANMPGSVATDLRIGVVTIKAGDPPSDHEPGHAQCQQRDPSGYIGGGHVLLSLS